MLKKHTVLSFAFCTLIVSSTFASVISCAVPGTKKTNRQVLETAQIAHDTGAQTSARQRSSRLRVVSALANGAIAVPSTVVTAITLLGLFMGNFDAKDNCIMATLSAIGAFSSYSAIKQIYHNIQNSPERSPNVISKTELVAHGVLGMVSGACLYVILLDSDPQSHKLFFSMPVLHTLQLCGRVFFKAAQSPDNRTLEQCAAETATT